MRFIAVALYFPPSHGTQQLVAHDHVLIYSQTDGPTFAVLECRFVPQILVVAARFRYSARGTVLVFRSIPNDDGIKTVREPT